MGGSVFATEQQLVSCIPNDDKIISQLVLEAFDSMATQDLVYRYKLIGNTTKPFLGDLDIAVDEQSLRTMLGVKLDASDDKFWIALEERLKTHCKHQWKLNKGFRQVHLLLPLVDAKGEHMTGCWTDGVQFIKTDVPFGEDVEEQAIPIPGMVQVDILIGNINWMSKVCSGAPKSSKWKALYRTNLLREIVKQIKWSEGQDKMLKHRLVLDYKRGVRHLTYVMVPPTGAQKVKQEVRVKERYVTKSGNGLAMMLFGPTVRWKDINSFEKLIKLCESKKFLYPELLKSSCENLEQELQRQKMPLPNALLKVIMGR